MIASLQRRVYSASMPAALLELLALFAFVLMPLGMSPAATAPAHHATTNMTGHCGEHSGQQPHKVTHCTDCAAACSVMVSEPATLPAPIALVPADVGPLRPWSVDGLHPEAEIPPPRLA